MKFHIKTYGCQMNERDSDAVAALLVERGHVRADDENAAEVVIVNTCSVRGKAESKALGKLGLLVAGKRKTPGRIVGAMGCMVQRLGDSLLEKVPGLDFGVGTHRLPALPGAIERAASGGRLAIDVGRDGEDADGLCGHAAPGVSEFVNILQGCNRGCSYCVVPQVRGGEWSRPARSILAEVESLAAAGVKEITLLGQSVMSYGRSHSVWPEDYASPRGFREPLARLLEAIDGVKGIQRVRFTSGHPSGCTPEMIRAMAELPSVCEHLHLPLQSGCDRILKTMRRGYTPDEYRRAVRALKSAIPDIAITTDVIAGFPSETEEEFETTLRFMDEIGFDNAFIFKYSPRPGTAAAEWKDDIPAAEKARRNKVLLDDQNRRSLAINETWVGRRAEVLVEGVSLRNPKRWAGRTRQNKIVVFEPAEGLMPGDLAEAAITRAWPQTLYGTVEPKTAGQA